MHAPSEPRHVEFVVYGGIGGAHFERAAHRHQLSAEHPSNFVDVAGKELTQRLAIHDPGKGIQYSNTQGADNTRVFGTP